MSFDSDLESGFLDLAVLRLETLSGRAQQFMDAHMVDVAIREILDPMKRLAASRGVSQRFIDAMTIRKLGFMKVAFVIDYIPGPNGIALNKLLEFGWSEHWIQPLDPINGPQALHWMQNGIDYFSMGHIVRGFRGYTMIFSMQTWGFVDRFVIRLVTMTSVYLEETAFK